jgi:hypothetical protein
MADLFITRSTGPTPGSPSLRDEGDFTAFERILGEAVTRYGMRLLAYCLMPNHFHLLLWPRGDRDLSQFMQWLTLTHTQRWHALHHTAGSGHDGLRRGRRGMPVRQECRLAGLGLGSSMLSRSRIDTFVGLVVPVDRFKLLPVILSALGRNGG